VNESKAEVLDVSGLLSAAVTARSSESVEAGVSALVKVGRHQERCDQQGPLQVCACHQQRENFQAVTEGS
jgi:hypothetical protein